MNNLGPFFFIFFFPEIEEQLRHSLAFLLKAVTNLEDYLAGHHT